MYVRMDISFSILPKEWIKSFNRTKYLIRLIVNYQVN